MPDIDTPIAAGLATTFCVPGGTGPVSVAPYLPTRGFEVSDFRVVDVDGPMFFGDRRAPISDMSVASQDRRIRPCGEGRSELALEVRRSTEGPQTAAGFEVRWEEPEPGGLFIPVGMVLCDGSASLPRCDRPGLSDQLAERIDELS